MTDAVASPETKAGWGVIGLLAAAQFIMVLDTTVMNVSISQVVADLNTTVVGLQTAITMYTLVMAAFMLIGGKIGDRWGAKRAFWIGLLVYGAGSLITALSPNLNVLLVGWSLIEGLGAVLVVPAIAALTAATYQGRQRALCYGILGGVAGASMAAGPLVGGWVTANYSWRYVFAGETVVVLGVLLFLKLIPATTGRKSKLDLGGAVLSAAGLGAIVLGVLQSSQWGWINPKAGVPTVNGVPLTPLGLSPTLWLIVIGGGLLMLFARREAAVKARGEEPLLDLALLEIPRMQAGLVIQWCQAFIIQATFFVLPLYLQTVLGFDALQTGKTILPLSIALFVFALGGSAATNRFSPKLIVQRGLVALLVGEVDAAALPGAGPGHVGLWRRHGADRGWAGIARLAGRQCHHVIRQPVPWWRGWWPAGDIAQPWRVTWRGARRLDRDRHAGLEFRFASGCRPEPARIGEAAGRGSCRDQRELRLDDTDRDSGHGGRRAGRPDRTDRGQLLKCSAPGATRWPGVSRPLRALRAGVGAAPARPEAVGGSKRADIVVAIETVSAPSPSSATVTSRARPLRAQVGESVANSRDSPNTRTRPLSFFD